MSEAITFQTVSTGDAATQNYRAFGSFVGWVKNTYPLTANALNLEMVSEHTMLFKWRGSNAHLKPILLTAHYDVVPVSPGSQGGWTHPPFAGRVADGYVWGRGAMDDKSGVITMLEATELLLSQNHKPQRTLYFSFSHDEEVGGTKGAAGVVKHSKILRGAVAMVIG